MPHSPRSVSWQGLHFESMTAFQEALAHRPEGLCQVSQFQIGRRHYQIDDSGQAHEQQCCFWRRLRCCFGDRAACRREMNVTAALRAAKDQLDAAASVVPAPSNDPAPLRQVRFALTDDVRLFTRSNRERLEIAAHRVYYLSLMVTHDKKKVEALFAAISTAYASVQSTAADVSAALTAKIASGQTDPEVARGKIAEVQASVTRAIRAVEITRTCVTKARRAQRHAQQAALTAQQAVNAMGGDQAGTLAHRVVEGTAARASEMRDIAETAKKKVVRARTDVRQVLAELQALASELMVAETGT